MSAFTRDQAIELAESRGLKRYRQNPVEDVQVLAWQSRMINDKEFEKIFHLSALAPARFFEMFRAPNSLYYSVDHNTGLINVAMWFEPSFFGAFCGVYMAPQVRHGVKAFGRVQAAYALGFSQFDMLGGVTTQPRIIPLHVRMGYTLSCKLPFQMNARDAWLLFYKKSDFEQSVMNPFRVRQSRRNMVWRQKDTGETRSGLQENAGL